MMGRWAFAGLGIALVVGCSRSSDNPSVSGADAGRDARGALGDAGRDSAEAHDARQAVEIPLALDVVRQTRHFGIIPVVGAHVLVVGTGASTEELTDAAGHAVVLVAEDTGPWDVTIALQGYGAISILGATGSIPGRVHLPVFATNLEPAFETRKLTGAIAGRVSTSSNVALFGPRMIGNADFVTRYAGSYADRPGPSPMRLLALEHTAAGVLLNGLWLDVPETGMDVTRDISFPSPPRPVSHTTMTLDTPTSGVVTGSGMTAAPANARRFEAGASYFVGTGVIQPVMGAAGHFTWDVDALDGDMAPTSVTADLKSADGREEIYVRSSVSPNDVIRVRPAEQLDASGGGFDGLSVTWSATSYEHVGASLVSLGAVRRTAWYVYSFGSAQVGSRGGPRLPQGLSLEDIGVESGAELDVNVFAETLPQGDAPWDFSGQGGLRGVIRVTGPFASSGRDAAARPRADGGTSADAGSAPDSGQLPFDARFDGIYALVDFTENALACREGPSALSGQTQRLFYAQRWPYAGTRLVACDDPTDCRAKAKQDRETQVIPGASWAYTANEPGAPSSGVCFSSTPATDAGLCDKELIEEARATGTPHGALRIEVRGVAVPPHGADAQGACSLDAATASSSGLPCSELKVITGQYQEAL